jgi:hypothetical protein
VSRSLLPANLPLFSRCLQLPIPLGVDLPTPGAHVLRRDIADGIVQADIVVMLDVTLHQTLHPEARSRIISDNGPQFVAKDFKKFIRISGMTHVRTSPHYPQSNGKIKRWNKSLKGECIRPGTLDDARRGYVFSTGAVHVRKT